MLVTVRRSFAAFATSLAFCVFVIRRSRRADTAGTATFLAFGSLTFLAFGFALLLAAFFFGAPGFANDHAARISRAGGSVVAIRFGAILQQLLHLR